MNHQMKPMNHQANQTMERPLAQYIDHTVLKPDNSVEEIKILCTEALEHGFYAVCVSPYYVKHAKRFLEGSNVKVSTVVGFPMGYAFTTAKVEEIKRAFIDGADEIDAVVNINAVKSEDWNYIKKVNLVSSD